MKTQKEKYEAAEYVPTPMTVEFVKPALPDKVGNYCLALMKKYNADKILLFGSRARGLADIETSDYDIAVQGDEEKRVSQRVGEYRTFVLDVVITKDIDKWYNFVHGGTYYNITDFQ